MSRCALSTHTRQSACPEQSTPKPPSCGYRQVQSRRIAAGTVHPPSLPGVLRCGTPGRLTLVPITRISRRALTQVTRPCSESHAAFQLAIHTPPTATPCDTRTGQGHRYSHHAHAAAGASQQWDLVSAALQLRPCTESWFRSAHAPWLRQRPVLMRARQPSHWSQPLVVSTA